jgi:hypothetical protein
VGITSAAIRARRAAYNALPNSRKTKIEEMRVFDVFAAVAAEARIDADSGINAAKPEPDIRCTVAGTRYYFELGEITDRPVAKSMADAIKYDEPSVPSQKFVTLKSAFVGCQTIHLQREQLTTY